MSDEDRSAIVVALAAGVGLGLASVLADGVIRLRAFGILGNIISPWTLAAFAVGRRRTSARGGAWVGSLALVCGVVTYYVLQAARLAISVQGPSIGYLGGGLLKGLLWVTAAVMAGAVMGWCGAVTARRGDTPLLAAVLPSAVLAAEVGFLVLDRRPWLWNLSQETYRLNEVAIMVALLVVAFALPLQLVIDRGRRRRAYLVLVTSGLVGALVLELLYRLVVA